jgi:hypothetical protein
LGYNVYINLFLLHKTVAVKHCYQLNESRLKIFNKNYKHTSLIRSDSDVTVTNGENDLITPKLYCEHTQKDNVSRNNAHLIKERSDSKKEKWKF